MSAQFELPGMPTKAPKPRIKRAQMVDAGVSPNEKPYGAAFECSRCGWKSGWLGMETHTEIRRGIPCPKCNP